MNKYIIEIEDVPFSKVRIDADGAQNINLYRAKGFNALVFDEHGLDKLTPFDKALSSELGEAYQKGFEAGQHEATTLEYQQGLEEGKKQARAQAHLDVCHDIERVAHGNYQQGLDDAWNAARKIVTWPDRSLVNSDTFDLDPGENIFTKYSASRAIEKLKAYEEQQKADEIKVGDEVEWECEKIIVIQTFTPNLQKPQLHGIGSNGCVYYAILIEDVKKTGRHFPQVEELLNAMKEGAE